MTPHQWSSESADVEVSPFRRWAITVCVMLITVMQVLDTSVINVALPHMQGALSAGVEEVTWALTSYLASNAIAIPATAWLTDLMGRRRFFLLVTVLFTGSSLASGLAPNLTLLVLARVLQGFGAGPIVPLSQAIVWEIFPPHQRGMAMAVWGIGVMFGPIVGPTLGGWITDNWSWRWIFYINLPIGALAFVLGGLFIFDSPFRSRTTRVDWAGLALMVVGFGAAQLVLDRGERAEWFASSTVLGLTVLAALALVAFVVRELLAREPIVDLRVFRDRNFAVGTTMMTALGLGLFSSMLLFALYAQKIMAYDAWTAGFVLAPGGLGNLLSLIVAGRIVARVDQRLLLAGGCLFNAVGTYMMTDLSLGMDYWALAWPRFVQGLGIGLTFVPLTVMALATIPREKVANATACFNLVRNLGGSFGVALAATFLARRSQYHQSTLVGHVNIWDPDTSRRLEELSRHFAAGGADGYTAERQAVAHLYRATVEQAQVLAFADEFWILAVIFTVLLCGIPLLRHVRIAPIVKEGASVVAEG
jgi:DHA2 family multidrug resistance protein